jgi:hypothetical protein
MQIEVTTVVEPEILLKISAGQCIAQHQTTVYDCIYVDGKWRANVIGASVIEFLCQNVKFWQPGKPTADGSYLVDYGDDHYAVAKFCDGDWTGTNGVERWRDI